MLIKQDSCRLDDTDFTVSCNFEIVECIIFIGRGILSNKRANFLSFIIIFALIIHRVHIQVSVDVLLHPCFEKALFKMMFEEKNQPCIYFP